MNEFDKVAEIFAEELKASSKNGFIKQLNDLRAEVEKLQLSAQEHLNKLNARS